MQSALTGEPGHHSAATPDALTYQRLSCVQVPAIPHTVFERPVFSFRRLPGMLKGGNLPGMLKGGELAPAPAAAPAGKRGRGGGGRGGGRKRSFVNTPGTDDPSAPKKVQATLSLGGLLGFRVPKNAEVINVEAAAASSLRLWRVRRHTR